MKSQNFCDCSRCRRLISQKTVDSQCAIIFLLDAAAKRFAPCTVPANRTSRGFSFASRIHPHLVRQRRRRRRCFTMFAAVCAERRVGLVFGAWQWIAFADVCVFVYHAQCECVHNTHKYCAYKHTNIETLVGRVCLWPLAAAPTFTTLAQQAHIAHIAPYPNNTLQ